MSVLVETLLPLPAMSVTLFACMLAIIVPAAVGVTIAVQVVPETKFKPVTAPVPVPESVISESVNELVVIASEKTIVKEIDAPEASTGST